MLPRKASGIQIGSVLERRHSEETLKDRSSDFSAKYLAVWHLQYLAETKPHLITPETVAGLMGLLRDEAVSHQTQAYFMYKAVGNALCAVLMHAEKQTDTVLVALRDILGTAHGPGHRAIAEACGSPPLSIQGPAISLDSSDISPHSGGFNERISLPELIEAVGTMSALCVLGRYLHYRGRDPSVILQATPA